MNEFPIMDTSDLSNRMKLYEDIECDRRFMSLLPILARIDGRAFHGFTKGMERPFDKIFHLLMIEVVEYLVEETNASIGYTQSDEISLVWLSTDIKSQVWFDGRIAKMTSQLAAHATLWFNLSLRESKYSHYQQLRPTFDARVWQVPNPTEAANCFLWRELDATKNSISMAASSVYSDKELFGKNSSEKQEMLFQKGINWNDYPVSFKRGTYVQRKRVMKKFSCEELEKLPEKHEARKNPNLKIERREISIIDMPVFSTVKNRENVIFKGEKPIVGE